MMRVEVQQLLPAKRDPITVDNAEVGVLYRVVGGTKPDRLGQLVLAIGWGRAALLTPLVSTDGNDLLVTNSTWELERADDVQVIIRNGVAT